MGHCGKHDADFLNFFYYFPFCIAVPEQPPEEDGRSNLPEKAGRDRKSRKVKARTTMLEEHTKDSCKEGH